MEQENNTYRSGRTPIYLVLNEFLLITLAALLVFWIMPVFPSLDFERPRLGLLLIPTILLSVLFYWSMVRRTKALTRFAEKGLLKDLVPTAHPMRHLFRFLLWRWAIVLLLIALMNPRIGTEEVEVATSGVDLMICVDVSNSMLAEDMAPDRMEAAKRSIYKLLDDLKGDRVGLVPFAGDAFIQLPLTSDYSAAGLFLSNLDTDIIPTQGTAIGKAIDLALDRLEKYSEGGAAIIVLTDGENHEDDAIAAAARASAQGITVHTVGIGTKEGAPLPVIVNGQKRGFKKDKNGETVISHYNADLLRSIAAAGKGLFLDPVDGYIDLSALHNEILRMDKVETGEQKFETYSERFQIFLLLAAFLILIESLLPGRKRTRALQAKNVN